MSKYIVLDGVSEYIVFQGLSIHVTYMTPDNSTKNNVVFFFVSGLKIEWYNNYQYRIAMYWTREKKYNFNHKLFGNKIIQNTLKIDETH